MTLALSDAATLIPQIFVKNLAGKSVGLQDLELSMTVSELKDKLLEHPSWDMNRESTRLIYAGKQLQDGNYHSTIVFIQSRLTIS